MIDGWGNSCEIALIWISLDLTDEQSTLAQVMAWSRQTTSHYLSQCWPRTLSPYGVTRPGKSHENHGVTWRHSLTGELWILPCLLCLGMKTLTCIKLPNVHSVNQTSYIDCFLVIHGYMLMSREFFCTWAMFTYHVAFIVYISHPMNSPYMWNAERDLTKSICHMSDDQ